MPRQSPQIPPRFDMKSSKVILGAVSYSGWENKLETGKNYEQHMSKLGKKIMTNKSPNTVESPKYRLTTAMSFS